MSYQKRVLLWTSQGSNDGGFTDSCERHGGENNGSAQARLTPKTAKYAWMDGLTWMNDIKAYGTMWSQNTADDDVGGSVAGKRVTHDYIKGGPSTRLEHLHVIDTYGYDTLDLYWQCRILAIEGLTYNTAAFKAAYAGALGNVAIADKVRVHAVGMPAIDSTDELFSIPNMFRQNIVDSLASEGAATAPPTDLTTDKCPGSGNPRTIPWFGGADPADANWDPDLWIQGAGVLYTQSRGIYPGNTADKWITYDQVVPAGCFETNSFFQQSFVGANGPPGMFQRGKMFVNAAATSERYSFCKPGDSLQFQIRVGYPNRAAQVTAQTTLTNSVTGGQSSHELSISGLHRIVLSIGAIGVPWHGAGVASSDHVINSAGVRVSTLAAGLQSTFLATSPVAPAVAPREHIRGRLWAVLTSRTGPS